LNFLGIGPGELLLILILAFVIFGPKRLPEIGRTLGKAMRELRNASDDLTSQFRDELEAASEELERLKEAASGELEAVSESVSEGLQTATEGLQVSTQVASEAMKPDTDAAEIQEKAAQSEG
jgi:TatA/E family protein of Tat protein translocase